MTKYDILYADPPWDYRGQTQHSSRESTGGATSHYEVLSLGALKKLELPAAADCLLFMWTTSPHLDQAIELGKAWGFAWSTVAFVWDKVRVNPGYYTMSQCELCLLFKRGSIPIPRGARNIRQLVVEERGRHSRKPDEVARRIVEMFPFHSRLELFARETKQGWDSWGLEL